MNRGDILGPGEMRGRFRADAFVALMSATLAGCGGPAQSGTDAADAAAGADAADAPMTTDVATGGDGSAGFFIAGDIDGMTRVGTHNIVPIEGSFVFQEANEEPSIDSPEWYFNFTLPADPLPLTLTCNSNYIEFREGPVATNRRFVSRTSTGTCSVLFAETAAGVLEGTFTANLRLSGTQMDYPVTNGRFRLPRAP
jgi:hypothetical protein